MSHDQTSLERFVRNRGVYFIPRTHGSRNGFLAQIYVGGGLIFAAATLAVAGASQQIPGMEMASLGPFIAGVTNVAVGTAFKSKGKHFPAQDFRITPEAKSFLAYLIRHFSVRRFEWNDPSINQYMVGPHSRAGVNYGGASLGVRAKNPKDILPPELFSLLERASFNYNRVCGILETGMNPTQSQKIVRPSQDAADETMLEILHQAAMISRYPESADSARQSVEARIASLAELGDRLEAIQTRIPSLSDRLSATSAIENVLEELKLEEMARNELSPRQETSDEFRERF